MEHIKLFKCLYMYQVYPHNKAIIGKLHLFYQNTELYVIQPISSYETQIHLTIKPN